MSSVPYTCSGSDPEQITSTVYENLQSSPQIFSLLDNMSFAEYFAKLDSSLESTPVRPSRLSKLSALLHGSKKDSDADRYENLESSSSGIYEDCDFPHRPSPLPEAEEEEEVHYSVPKCTPARPAVDPDYNGPVPVQEAQSVSSFINSVPSSPKTSPVILSANNHSTTGDRDNTEDSFRNPVILSKGSSVANTVPSSTFKSNNSQCSNSEFGGYANGSDSAVEIDSISPDSEPEVGESRSNNAFVEVPIGSSGPGQMAHVSPVISSVNGVTTIEIKPVHHIIDLPPNKLEEIRRRRGQFKKATRLSQYMSADFKLEAPAPGIAMNRFGNVVRKKVGGWVRKIHEEVDESTKAGGHATIRRGVTVNGQGQHTLRSVGSSATGSSGSGFTSDSSSLQSDPDNQILDIHGVQGQNEFEDLRKLVKQGGDFCKDLATVLQERSELEAQYSKGLAKLSSKLLKASKEATGSVAHAWQAVAVQIDTQAELHRCWSAVLQDELAKPLKSSSETQSKIRKSVEGLVDKTTRNLAEWRTAESKAKRQCFSSSKEFEKLQDALPNAEIKSRLLSVPPTDPIKMEAKKRKAEETVRRADIEYYTFCVRSERARLEWEGSIRNGSTCLRTLEEEKLTLLKDLALKYFESMNDIMPKLMRSTEVLEEPIKACNIEQDMQTIVLRRHACSEQLLPDFYAEDTSNLMRKERRSEVLQKCLFLIKQDLDRERKGAIGVENLAKAIADSTKIDNTQNDVSDKLYYIKSMLLYLEAARIKLELAIADIEGRPKPVSSLLKYLRHQRDKQGLPQTILKVPSWARDECLTPSPTSESPPHWTDKRNNDVGIVDHDTDFDEFSSEAGSSDNVYEEEKEDVPSIGKCRVLYDYDKNLFDELTIRAGDVIRIHDKQEDGWWLGELKGTIGIFPATYVEEIEEGNSPEQSS